MSDLGRPVRTAEGLRQHLLRYSAEDQGPDTRDWLLGVADICREAQEAGIDPEPILRDAAARSSDVDRYGMGSTRALLLRFV